MHKLIVSFFVVVWANLGMWWGEEKVNQWGYNSTTLSIDTLRKDTIKPFRVGLRRDTTYRPDTIGAVINSSIHVNELSHIAVCAGSSVIIPFSTKGEFDKSNRFLVQIADVAGRFVSLPDSFQYSPARITLPLNRSGLITVRVVSTIPTWSAQPSD
ncbi:MAG: hypothetical protein R2822_29205 [Spirosomataceae bacterium]